MRSLKGWVVLTSQNSELGHTCQVLVQLSTYNNYIAQNTYSSSVSLVPIQLLIASMHVLSAVCFTSSFKLVVPSLKEKAYTFLRRGANNAFVSIFIGPRSDHSLPMSVTHWLTDSLTHSLTNMLKLDVMTLMKIEWIDPCWLGCSNRKCRICRLCRLCRLCRIGRICRICKLWWICRICDYAEYTAVSYTHLTLPTIYSV